MSADKKKKRGSGLRSSVWYFFDKVENNEGVTFVKCRICQQIIKFCGNTTNMKSHCQLKHTSEWKQCNAENATNIQCYYALGEEAAQQIIAEVSENMGTTGQGETTEQPQILYVTTASVAEGEEIHESEAQSEGHESESSSQKQNGDTKAMFLTHPQSGEAKQIILNHPGKPGRTRKVAKRQNSWFKNSHKLIAAQSDEEEEEETPKKKKRSEGHLFEHFGNYVASLLEVLPKKAALDMQGKITTMLLNEHSRLA